MKAWPVQDAKARFSEMLDACLREGPQMVTRRGTGSRVDCLRRGLLASAVVRRQIIDDGLGISGADRGAVGLDHFVNFAFPALAIEKVRVDAWIIQRVTSAAIAFHDITSGRVFERYGFFGPGRQAENCDYCADQEMPHYVDHTALTVSERSTLLL